MVLFPEFMWNRKAGFSGKPILTITNQSSKVNAAIQGQLKAERGSEAFVIYQTKINAKYHQIRIKFYIHTAQLLMQATGGQYHYLVNRN